MQEDPRIAVARFVFERENRGISIFVFLAAAGIFLDVWDLTAFSFVISPFVSVFAPTSMMKALAVTSANIGAVAGAILGGALTDRLGRRSMFIYSMLIFVATAFLQALSTSVVEFTVFRAIMGFGLGADVATGFSYIYEFASSGQRRNFYSLWGYAFSVTAIVAVLTTLAALTFHTGYNLIWRIPFILGGVFAAVIIILRFALPESPIWLAYRGRYSRVRAALESAYGSVPDGIPEHDMPAAGPDIVKKFREVFARGRNRVLGFAISMNVIVGVVSWGFVFYITYSLTSLGITSYAGALVFDLFIFGSAFAGSYLSPYLAGRIGSKWGSVIPSAGIVAALFLSLLAVQGIIPLISFVPIAAAILFLEYLGPMSYNAIVNHAYPSSVRGSVNGVNYMVNKVVEAATGFMGGTYDFFVVTAVNASFVLLCTVAAIVLGSNVILLNPVTVEKDGLAAETA